MRCRCCIAVLTILLLCLFLPLAQAQKTAGTITGTVVDPTGAVVPGATVNVTNQATGATRTGTTNDQGSFTFPELSTGTYTVAVSKAGFKEVSQKNVELHTADITTLKISLQVGAATERVVVEASPVMIETQSGEVSNVMLGQQVRELPMNGRNFVQLTTLVPGASVSENFDNKNKGLLAGVDISFSGAPADANQWTVDGANNNDIGSQRTILIYPSIDGIEEFKILRNSYGPEFGGGGGAQINVVTKGGGNQLHGDVYYFGRNDILNAKSYFLRPQNGTTCAAGDLSCQKQRLRRNDWGYTIGGPIKKDKIFFFWSEEWNRERRGVVRRDQVLSADERKGDFRALAARIAQVGGAGNCGRSLPTDPGASGAAFSYNGQANVIDPARISPGGAAIIAMQPLPTISDPCVNQNWVSQVPVPLNWREENVRGDINLTKSTTLMLRYAQDTWVNPTEAYEEGGLWGSQYWPAVNDSWYQPGKQAVAKLTTTISSTAVNDFQFSWSANRIHIIDGGTDPSLKTAILAAIPTIYPTSGKMHGANNEVPTCWCSSFFGTMAPWDNRQDLFTWKDDFSKVVGKHTLKLGFFYDRNAKDEENGSGAEAGQFWGVGGYGNSVNWGPGTGNNFGANLLLKGILWGGAESARNILSQIRWRDAEFYAGDSWKVSRRLNFDYGVRWSLVRPEFLVDNRWSSFSPAAYDPNLGGDPCNGILLPKGAPNLCQTLGFKGGTYIDRRAFQPDNNRMFAPRLGFAWDVFGNQRFALRGGIGQFFARDPVGLAIRTNGGNPPFGPLVADYRTLDGPLVVGTNLFDGGGTTNLVAGGTPTRGFEDNPNGSNSWQWNLTTETALWRDAKLEVGWVALRGIHLQASHNINQIAPANRVSYIKRGFTSGDNRADLFPYGKLTTSPIWMWDHRGDSIYHSLQMMFTTKIHRNSIFQTSYTWSKNIADTDLGYGDAGTQIGDTYNPRSTRGLANFDRRHVFNASLVYNLSALEGRNRFLRGIAGGWETSTILQFASGPALSITGGLVNPVYNGAVVGGFNPWGIGDTNTFDSLPNVVAGTSCTTGDRENFLNPAHFTFDGAVLGTRANTGRGQCAGPGMANVDLALDKNWNLPFGGNKVFGEKARLQFRLETFNLFNHPMFRFNGNNLGINFTGVTLDSNNVLHGGTPQTGSKFGVVPLASNIGNREVQFALKLIF